MTDEVDSLCHSDNSVQLGFSVEKQSCICMLPCRDGPLVEQKIGAWSEGEGLMIEEPDMWARRNNLHGMSHISKKSMTLEQQIQRF